MGELMLGLSDEGVVERLRTRKSGEYPDLLCQKAANLIERLMAMSEDELIRQLRFEADANATEVRRITRERDELQLQIKEARHDLLMCRNHQIDLRRERDDARRALDTLSDNFKHGWAKETRYDTIEAVQKIARAAILAIGVDTNQ